MIALDIKDTSYLTFKVKLQCFIGTAFTTTCVLLNCFGFLRAPKIIENKNYVLKSRLN